VREGLRALLAQDEDFAVSAAADGSLADQTPPNVIVCCTDMPDEVRGLRARWPQAGLLVVADLSPAAAGRLTKLGALGLFPLSAEPDELIWAVHSVAQGRLTLHPTALRALVAHLAATGSTPLPPPVQLTARERDVLRYLTLGASDKDIAQQLYLSVRTVQSHLVHLYHKLGVHSRTEAALTAIRAGWFDETSADKNLDQFSNSTEADLRHLALVGARLD
jgi:DNA-binding NarL/FixJ family response regulator